jgi:hypothetical protein
VSDWQGQIPRCFSADDVVFATSPSELSAAWQLRAETSEVGIPSSLLESAIEDWLHTQVSNTGHLYEQMIRVRSFFGS